MKLFGTYLVTGGTNGFGLNTAKWLVERGVKNLILLSRTGKLDNEDLNYFEDKECNIILRSTDVNSYDQLKTIFEEIKETNIKLKGIIHAAAVYEDELIANLSDENYKKVLFTKIRGAYYLDLLSRDIDLDNFILYSSVTTTFGNIGQANYVAANGFLESLALQRRASGLRANYISFGGILDTGLLMRNKKLKNALVNQMGEGLITVEQALMSLDKLISGNDPGFAVMDINVQQMEKSMPIFLSSRFDVLRFADKKENSLNNADFKNYIKGLTPEQARKELLLVIQEEISSILELSIDEVNVKKPLKEFGFDSLMGFDLVVSLEKRVGIAIPAFSLQQAGNIDKIADVIMSRLLGDYKEAEDDQEKILYSQHGEK